MRAWHVFAAHFAVVLILVNCSSKLKPIPGDYKMTDASKNGFIYGMVSIDVPGGTGVELELVNRLTRKKRVYTKSFLSTPYAKRESDFALQIAPGIWEVAKATVAMKDAEPLALDTRANFKVEEGMGNYVGTWIFGREGIRFENQKRFQDDKIVENHPHIPLSQTLSTIPLN